MAPPFSLFDQAEDRFEDLAWGQVLVTPFELGAWALLEPMGEQNHAPQLCWIRPDLLGCVWMAGSGEGTAGMSVFLSLLGAEGGRLVGTAADFPRSGAVGAEPLAVRL